MKYKNFENDFEVVFDFLTIHIENADKKYNLYNLKRFVTNQNYKTNMYLGDGPTYTKHPFLIDMLEYIYKNTNDSKWMDLIKIFEIDKHEKRINHWDDFINKCKNIDFAYKKIEKFPWGNSIGSKKKVEISVDDIWGSDAREHLTWIELLSQSNLAEKDTNKPIYDIAMDLYKSIEEGINEGMYCVGDKYFLSDAHNRLCFLKFYSALYNTNKIVKMYSVHYYI